MRQGEIMTILMMNIRADIRIRRCELSHRRDKRDLLLLQLARLLYINIYNF